jgi:microcystin-dependent protein
MAKNKISEYSSTASNNTDIGGINIAEGCAPSGINNAIRELMAQIKDQQTGSDADNFVVGGAFTCTGAAVFSSTVALGATATATTQSAGDNSTKVATTAYVATAISAGIPSGGIIIWSGSSSAIPSGWYLCNGSNSTPDLRNRFVVGAGSTYSVAATGGSADAITVSHTHTVSDPGHRHNILMSSANNTLNSTPSKLSTTQNQTGNTETATTGISIDSAGASGTNANLPPYYALCYIMKA